MDAWTDKLSDYLDGELSDAERAAVDAHVASCPSCAATLRDLEQVVERARSLPARPPEGDLWPGIADRIERTPPTRVLRFARGEARRISFTVPQLAAASVVLALVSGGLAWRLHDGRANPPAVAVTAPPGVAPAEPPAERLATPAALPVALADAQYDAAVADLQSALDRGRGRLDKTTIAIVEHNLHIIDQAIDQARQALEADPANGYLSGHLAEARRRKLDLLRRAAALTAAND